MNKLFLKKNHETIGIFHLFCIIIQKNSKKSNKKGKGKIGLSC